MAEESRNCTDQRALDECDQQIAYLRAQASRNQRFAYLATLTIMLSSAAIPLMLLVSTQNAPFLIGKLLPSCLAAAAALAAGAAQVVRPHDRWRAFRREQRLLEAERIAYVYTIGAYNSSDRDRLLIERVIASRRDILHEWLNLMPETAQALAALDERPETTTRSSSA